MFDFVLTDRPVVLLVPDLDQYRDVERGFYFDIEARSPGPLVTTTADVVDVLTGPDAERTAVRTSGRCSAPSRTVPRRPGWSSIVWTV